MIVTFGFGQEVAVLTISLFVAGYCVGPIIWGPLSESYGRRPVFIGSFFVYTCFQVGCALSKNTASILVFRFLGGTFAAAPLTNSGALLADIWDGDNRGRAMSLFALAPFVGPSVGPIVSGFIQVSGTSWRWVFWILTIFAGVCLALIIIFVPETYAPKILAQKAKRLRKDTQEERWYAPCKFYSLLPLFFSYFFRDLLTWDISGETGPFFQGEIERYPIETIHHPCSRTHAYGRYFVHEFRVWFGLPLV